MMTTVNNSGLGGTNGYSTDKGVAQNVNVSDATQMENNFIALMVAQIQNQDPTNPVDSTQFLNQYSAMSQVKSLENMSELSKNNMVLLDNLQTLTASGLVGQEVNVNVDSLQLEGTAVKGQLNLGYASSPTVVTLTSASGQATDVQLGSQVAGKVNFTINPTALGLAPGKYSITATTSSGEYPAIEVTGKVNGVRVSANGPVLDVAGAGSVPFYNITEFGQTPVAGLL
jgi:flagellar basal-body rod modification protein FlgD